MIKLRLLGATTLRKDDGNFDHSFVAGPKRLALLTYLTLVRPRGFQRRDKLVTLFWPERGQKSARNALSNLLYHIRHSLGDAAVLNRGMEEISINGEKFWCDAVAFEETLERNEERKALDLYHGDLLPSFHVTDVSNEFQTWLDAERVRLRGRAAEAAWMLAEKAKQAGNLNSARRWTKKAASYSEFSEETYRRLIMLLYKIGDRSGALKAYKKFEDLIRKEWEMEPSKEIQAFAKKIRNDKTPVPLKMPAEEFEEKPERSIAVIPFAALGTENNIFADGIHDDLLTRLSNITGLEVTSRTSVMRYRKTRESLKTISQELLVNWVVEGSVQQTGNHVQVRVRLVNAKKDRQIWGRDYQKELTADNLFLIQGEIAKQIARSLQVTLSPEEEQRVVQKPTDDLEAYRLYAQGRRYLDQRTEEAMHKALNCFRQAIEQDADYVLAWTGIADTLSLFRFYGYDHPQNTYDHRKAAEYALELDPNSGEAHASMGILYSFHTRGPQALSELRRAAALTPSYAEVWIWLGWVLLCLGRPEEAVEPARQSVSLDPLAPAFRVYLAEIYLANGQSELAMQEARRAREIEPEYGLTHFMEGLVYYRIGELEKAVSSLRQALSLVSPHGIPTHDEIKALLAVTHLASGNMDEVNTLSEEINEPFSTGLIYAIMGNEEAAFDLFDRVGTWNSFSNELIRYFLPDVLGPLREHRRYNQLIEAINKSWGLNTDGSVPSVESNSDL